MATLTEWKDILKAQIESFEMLSKSEIQHIQNGNSDITGYFRNNFFEPWKGPMLLTHIDYETARPFSGDGNRYRLFTKTLPIEPQTVTLIPWNLKKSPVSQGTLTIIEYGNGDIIVTRQVENVLWANVTAYRPITIDIEEG